MVHFEALAAGRSGEVGNSEWYEFMDTQAADTFSDGHVRRVTEIAMLVAKSFSVFEYLEVPGNSPSMTEMESEGPPLRTWAVNNGVVKREEGRPGQAHRLVIVLKSIYIGVWVSQDDYYFVLADKKFFQLHSGYHPGKGGDKYYVCDGWAALEALLWSIMVP